MPTIKQWNKDRAKLKVEYEERGITTCEIRLPGCAVNNFLSFAHRNKRVFYNTHPELLGDFSETLLSCIPCHQKLEVSRELTNEYFNKLR